MHDNFPQSTSNAEADAFKVSTFRINTIEVSSDQLKQSLLINAKNCVATYLATGDIPAAAIKLNRINEILAKLAAGVRPPFIDLYDLGGSLFLTADNTTDTSETTYLYVKDLTIKIPIMI